MLKNAFANVIGGAGTALFNLLLPAMVVRHLGKVEFSLWSLALQVLVYLQIFGFGLQIAVTRFIAHAHELGDIEDQRKTVAAGLMLARRFIALALLAVVLLVLVYPMLFSNVPPEMTTDFRLSVGLLGGSAALQLAALVPAGIFTGMHRNIIPVLLQMSVRFAALFSLWLALIQKTGLVVLALVMAGVSVLIVPISKLAVGRWAGHLHGNLGKVDRARLSELGAYCSSMAVWNIAMLFVSGLATMIVGYLDFQKTGAYSLATSIITIMVGVQQALMSPLLPAGARLNARDETRDQLPQLLIRSTRICLLGLFASVLAIEFLGRPLLEVWLGKQTYVDDVFGLLVILAIANLIRNTALPYAMLLLSVNRQKQVQYTVVIEGSVTLLSSLFLGHLYGAKGVAYGSLIGSLSGVASNFLFNFSKTRVLVPNTLHYSVASLLVLVMPAIAVLSFWSN